MASDDMQALIKDGRAITGCPGGEEPPESGDWSKVMVQLWMGV